jgi:hypothetical protein
VLAVGAAAKGGDQIGQVLFGALLGGQYSPHVFTRLHDEAHTCLDQVRDSGDLLIVAFEVLRGGQFFRW